MKQKKKKMTFNNGKITDYNLKSNYNKYLY